MTFWQGLSYLLEKVWNNIFAIQIPLIGISIKTMLIGVFCLMTGVGIFRRIFQGSMELSVGKETTGGSKSRYGNAENRKGKISNKRKDDEL